MPNNRLSYIFQMNYNYLVLLLLFFVVTILILTRVLFSRRHPSIGDLVFDFFTQCMGQTRNRVYTRPFAKILLACTLILAYMFWAVNCATLFRLLTTNKFEAFSNYSELNESGRDIFVSRTTMDKYAGVKSILRYEGNVYLWTNLIPCSVSGI